MLVQAVLILLVAVLPISLAGHQKRFADDDENILFAQVQLEQNVRRQLTLLHEWEARYPSTDFAANRCEKFVEAYRHLQEYREAFRYAVQYVPVAVSEKYALRDVVTLGPKLNNPTKLEVDATYRAARRLLELTPAPPKSGSDIEDLLREMRRGEDLELRRTAKLAIAWVGNHR